MRFVGGGGGVDELPCAVSTVRGSESADSSPYTIPANLIVYCVCACSPVKLYDVPDAFVIVPELSELL